MRDFDGIVPLCQEPFVSFARSGRRPLRRCFRLLDDGEPSVRFTSILALLCEIDLYSQLELRDDTLLWSSPSRGQGNGNRQPQTREHHRRQRF